MYFASIYLYHTGVFPETILKELSQEKRKRLFLPRQANGEKRGGSSSATGAFIHLTPRGKAACARHQEKRKRLSLPRQANGEKRGGSSSATAAFIYLTPRGKAVELDTNLSTD